MPKTYGCCTEVGQPGSGDDIGSLPGNKAALTDSTPGVAYYINNGIIGFVPIYDYRYEQGSNGYFHIIGYAGFQIVHVKGAKEIQGILRQVIFPARSRRHRPALPAHRWRYSSSTDGGARPRSCSGLAPRPWSHPARALLVSVRLVMFRRGAPGPLDFGVGDYTFGD